MHLRLRKTHHAAYGWMVGMLALGCGASHSPQSNGQSHWLRECSADKQCGELSCLCGVCSSTCEHSADCRSAVGENGVCKPATLAAGSGTCSSMVAKKLVCLAECSRDSECSARDKHLVCTSGICSVRTNAIDAGIAESSKDDGGRATVTLPMDAGSNRSAGGEQDSGVATDASTADASPAPTKMVVLAANALTCEKSEPSHVPANVMTMLSDVSASPWIVSNDVLTWSTLDDSGTPTLWHKTLQADAGSPTSTQLDSKSALGQELAADGADTLVMLGGAQGIDVNDIVMKWEPASGSALNLAIEPGAQMGGLLMDADSVYWMQANAGMLTAWRTPRVPGDDTSLGSTPYVYMSADDAAGPIMIGDFVYVAVSVSGNGQVFRASKDGTTQLAAFGPTLPYVKALATDGTDLFLLLDQPVGKLGNPTMSARVARMTSTGTLSNVIDLAEPGTDLIVSSDRIYWTSTKMEDSFPWTSATHGSLWSIATDGSGTPVEEVHVPGNVVLEHLYSDHGDIYFSLGCFEAVKSGWHVNAHIMRLMP